MSVKERSSIEKALAELDDVAPNAPLLALGQTVFWDEPMKAGIALAAKRLGRPRTLVAGVHDTDYFAKLPESRGATGSTGPRFKAVPHNDTTTRGLWSAAGEFSALFGSETVVTRDALQSAGLRVAKLAAARPDFLDKATEAWGWRGIVALGDHAPITKDVPIRQLLTELMATFNWAVGETLNCLSGQGREGAVELADQLTAAICDASEDPLQSVSDFYRRLLPIFYEFCANAPVEIDTTATSELLTFNCRTCRSSRFKLPDLFVNQATRKVACDMYDEAIKGSSGLYELARFGSGAIPFDLIIPGEGRGTIRLGNRGAVIMTPNPNFLSFKKPLESVSEFAEFVEAKYGPDCVLVGKAVTLVGMLAPEFVFVFHEGASSYVKHSRRLHTLLVEQGHPIHMNPILRVKYDVWGSLKVCCSWLRLPEPFQRPFGTEELCAPSLSARWRDVSAEQEITLNTLAGLRRPIELIKHFEAAYGGSWNSLAVEYKGLQDELETLHGSLERIKVERYRLYDRDRDLGRLRLDAERIKGDHFRAKIFELEPSAADIEDRRRLSQAVEDIIQERSKLQNEIRRLRHTQSELIHADKIKRIHERRRSIELEADLKRMRLIREAVISSKGLARANLRPSAWWFRLVCPDGLWFRETIESAECYIEPL